MIKRLFERLAMSIRAWWERRTFKRSVRKWCAGQGRLADEHEREQQDNG